MRTMIVLLRLALLLALPVFGAQAGDEARFDPPLDGVYLGLGGTAQGGRLRIDTVEPGSAARRAGLLPGDEILRLGSEGSFGSFEDFSRAVRRLRRGEGVEVQVLRGVTRESLTLVPDPGILRDLYRLTGYLRESEFLRGRQEFPGVLRELESSTPQALREAERSSQAYSILNRALGRLGTSHTAIIPPWTFKNLFAERSEGEEGHWTGLILERIERPEGAGHFALEVLDASPAREAGVVPGDEVLGVNGLPVETSPRLSLAGYEAGRPRSTLQVDRGETIALGIRRSPGEPGRLLRLSAGPISGLRASTASWRVFQRDGRRLAYLHLWNLLSPELPRLVKKVLAFGPSWAEGVVIDLRGRGGQVGVMNGVLEVLRAERRPLSLLIDRETRSAKEILAFRLKGRAVLVGERTAGAVLPGECRQLPGGAMVMLPVDVRQLDRYTAGGALEGRGVDPDLPVARPGPYSAGADPILEAGIRAVLEKLHDLPPARRL